MRKGTCKRWPPWGHHRDKGSRSGPTEGLGAVSPSRHSCPGGFGDRVTFSTANNGLQAPRGALTETPRKAKEILSFPTLSAAPPKPGFHFFPLFCPPKNPSGGGAPFPPPLQTRRQGALRAGGAGESSERGADVIAGWAGGRGMGEAPHCDVTREGGVASGSSAPAGDGAFIHKERPPSLNGAPPWEPRRCHPRVTPAVGTGKG